VDQQGLDPKGVGFKLEVLKFAPRFHRAFIAHPPTSAPVRGRRRIALTWRFGPHESAPVRTRRVRDAEVVGSNPAVPTQKPQVRPLSGAACWFARVFHRASIARHRPRPCPR